VYAGYQGRIQEGGDCRAAAPLNPSRRNLENADFLDTVVSKVLRDLPFRRNQPLKSADDEYFRVLTNKLLKQKTRRLDSMIESLNV
jgi:hypothetical protein